MKFWILLQAIFFALTVVACTRNIDGAVQQGMQPTHQSDSISMTPTELPSRTVAPRPSLTSVPVVTQTTSPTHEEVVEVICSPLEFHPIQELFEIVSDPYKPPPAGTDMRHPAVDFSYYRWGEREGIEGLSIQAVFPGIVAAAQGNRIPFGNLVIIETALSDIPEPLLSGIDYTPGESLYLLYAHMKEQPLFTLGETVSCGQILGSVGKTGGEGTDFYIPHLHLEARIGPPDLRIESMAFYDTRATQSEMDDYRTWSMSGDYRHFDPMLLFSNYVSETYHPEN